MRHGVESGSIVALNHALNLYHCSGILVGYGPSSLQALRLGTSSYCKQVCCETGFCEAEFPKPDSKIRES
ncbi:hypothetical protein KUCAC02_002832 [Chaenocephalus aceratus]|uniref:Uncharacterized protein n=1 Tax=Chaenocephalus aceratus TaxID=36190 RepID=A0ACB9WKB9_CHAAC|nr:hypothetical protein KUCAC02_002832 [Chaenocephalus aceratus]